MRSVNSIAYQAHKSYMGYVNSINAVQKHRHHWENKSLPPPPPPPQIFSIPSITHWVESINFENQGCINNDKKFFPMPIANIILIGLISPEIFKQDNNVATVLITRGENNKRLIRNVLTG